MKDPQRLLADEETSDLARSLLEAGRARREPEGARDRVWARMAVGIGAGAAAANVAAQTGTGAATGAGAKGAAVALAMTKGKLLVIGVVVVTAASVGVVATRPSEPVATVVSAPAAPAPASTERGMVATPAEDVDVSPEEPKAPPPEAVATATEGKGDVTARPSASGKGNPETANGRTGTGDEAAGRSRETNSLREEALLLQQARAALARRDPSAARAKLDEARARFPDGQLVQERDALEVRVAVASGDGARAASLARAFAERYPESPLRAGVEAISRAPEER